MLWEGKKKKKLVIRKDWRKGGKIQGKKEGDKGRGAEEQKREDGGMPVLCKSALKSSQTCLLFKKWGCFLSPARNVSELCGLWGCWLPELAETALLPVSPRRSANIEGLSSSVSLGHSAWGLEIFGMLNKELKKIQFSMVSLYLGWLLSTNYFFLLPSLRFARKYNEILLSLHIPSRRKWTQSRLFGKV